MTPLIFIIIIAFLIMIMAAQSKSKEPMQLSRETASKLLDMDANSNKVEGAAFQFLESTWILSNSKNIDIVKSRYEFCITLIATFEAGVNNSDYLTLINAGISRYINSYPDRDMMSFQKSILETPSIQAMNEAYCLCMSMCCARYVADETMDISKLKRKSAIERRIGIVRINLEGALHDLKDNCSNSENYFPCSTQIREMIQGIAHEKPGATDTYPNSVSL